MDIFLNEQALGPIDGTDATVGDVVRAMGVHIAPGQILTGVAIDGVLFSAGEEERFARRNAGAVSKLGLVTQSVAVFASSMRREIGEALELTSRKLSRIVELLHGGEERAAQQALATSFEEVRLLLTLEQQIATLESVALPPALDSMAGVVAELLSAQESRDLPRLTRVLRMGLVPIVEAWRQARQEIAPATQAMAQAGA